MARSSSFMVAVALLGLALCADVAKAKGGDELGGYYTPSPPGITQSGDDKGGLRPKPPSPPKGKDDKSPPSPAVKYSPPEDKYSPPSPDDKRKPPSPVAGTLSWEADARAASKSIKTNGRARLSLVYTPGGNGTFSGVLTVEKIVDFTMAHIHLNTTQYNGTIGLWLLPSDKSGPLKQPLTGSFSVKFSVDASLLNSVSGSQFVQLLTSGLTYLDVHTVKYPAGELQGVPKVK